MSDVITFNTETGDYGQVQKHKDPWHHLGAADWVQKQVDWANQSEPAGAGLVEPISKLKGELVGVEIGVCLGATTETFLNQVPNIRHIYAVDNYPAFVDWNGGDINEERQQLMKEHAVERLTTFGDRVIFKYQSSIDFANLLSVTKQEFFDFVFIDGDHSYEGSSADFEAYYPLVKKGGIFAGHDIVLPGVSKALKDFFKEDFSKIKQVSNSGWYLIKE